MFRILRDDITGRIGSRAPTHPVALCYRDNVTLHFEVFQLAHNLSFIDIVNDETVIHYP